MALSRVSLRVPAEDLAEIDRRAAARNMSRTRYMLGAALADGLLRTQTESQCVELTAQLEALAERVGRIESITFQ